MGQAYPNAKTLRRLTFVSPDKPQDSSDGQLNVQSLLHREMVAITNRRVITASPQDFIQKGTVTGSYPLEELTWGFLNEQDSLAQLHVTHEQRQFEWCFPSAGRVAARTGVAT